MLFMSKASGKHEFHEHYYYITAKGPSTSCCITMIQNRAPQNYNWHIVLYVREWARAKKSFSGSPQMWWAIGQWPIWPIGKSGAGWLFELHTLVLYRNEYWHHILINMQLGMVLLHWYICYHYLRKHFYRLYNHIVLYTDISNIIYIYILCTTFFVL